MDGELRKFVYDRSVSIEEENLRDVTSSINNERTRAGIIVGFYFLAVIELYPILLESNLHIQIISVGSLLLSAYFLVKSFYSKKTNAGVIVDKNFTYDKWKDECDFLEKYFDVLKTNKISQKKLLKQISKNVKYSIILIAVAILIPVFTNLYFMSSPNKGNEENNPMSPDIRELSESKGGNEEKQNPMSPDTHEKGA